MITFTKLIMSIAGLALLGCNSDSADQLVGNSGGGATYNVSTTAPTVRPIILTQSATLVYGSVAIGSTQAQTVTLTNAGTALAMMTTATVVSSKYTVTADTCSGTALTVGANCAITFLYTPTVAGIDTSTATITYQDASNVSYTYVENLTGAGTVPQPSLISAPASYAFPLTSVGANVSQSFIVSNSSVGAASLQSAAITGSGYSITTDGCNLQTLSAISVPSTCTVTVQFAPAIPGSTLGALTLNYKNSANVASTATISLSGVGNSPQPTLSYSPLNPSFGSVATGATYVLPITVSNTSTVSATLGMPSFTNTGFSKYASSCESSGSAIVLGSGNSCVIQVLFSPIAVQTYNSVLSLGFTSAQGITSTITNTLTGTGVAPSVSFSFSGFTGVVGTDSTSLTGTGVTLQWTAQSLASYYVVTQTGGGGGTVVSPHVFPGTIHTYNVTGLTPGHTYSFRVNAFDSNGVSDGNSNLVTITTPNVTGATFAGWSDAVGLGSVYTDIGTVDNSLGNTGTNRLDRNLAHVAGFDSTMVNTTSGALTLSANPFQTGQRVTFRSDGTAPTGLTSGNIYYVIYNSASSVFLASSAANAAAGTAIVPSTAGSGNMSLMSMGVVKLGWEAFTFSPSGTATAYKVYRSATSSSSGFSLIGTSSTQSFVDYQVNDNTAYWYYVNPVISGSEIIAATSNDSVIQIQVPPQDMALLHRWIANREACTSLLGFTWPGGVNRNNNYSCAYTWGGGYAPQVPLSAKAQWDLGYSLVIDRWQNGCKFTSLGTGTPSGGTTNAVYLQQGGTSSGVNGVVNLQCYIKDATFGWQSEATAPTSDRALMKTNYPGYPGTQLNQSQAYTTCQQRSVAGVVDGNGNSALRLFRIHEAVLARAVQGQNVNYRSPSVLNNIFNGVNLPVNGSCNTVLMNSWNNGFLNGVTLPHPAGYANAGNTLMSGSWLTRSCYSRYEISNLWDLTAEWTSDQYFASSTGGGYFMASGLDAGANLLENFQTNGTMGPSNNYQGNNSSGTIGTYSSSTVILPMFGVTAVSASTTLGSRAVDLTNIDFGINSTATSAISSQGTNTNGVALNSFVMYSGNANRYNFTIDSNTATYGNAWNMGFFSLRCMGQVGP